MEIGINLKKLRTGKKMSQKDLADALCVSPQAVSRWENDEVEPDISTLSKMSEIFGVSVDTLITGKSSEDADAVDVIPIVVPIKKEEKTDLPEKKEEIGKCGKCGKPLYKGDDITTATIQNPKTKINKSVVLCEDCAKKEKENTPHIEMKDGKVVKKPMKSRRGVHLSGDFGIKSTIGGAVAGIAAFVIALITCLNNGFGTASAIGIGFGSLYTVFATVYCMFTGSYILEVFIDVASTSVKFPGLIFSWSLDGIIWLIGMKILFAVLGFLAGCACAVFAVFLAILLSIVSFPFIFIHNLIHGCD